MLSFLGDYPHLKTLIYFFIHLSDAENLAIWLDVSLPTLESELGNQNFPRYVVFAESQNIINNFILRKFQPKTTILQKTTKHLIFGSFLGIFHKSLAVTQFQDWKTDVGTEDQREPNS